MPWTITIPELTPSQNTLAFMHWAALKQHKEYWFMRLRSKATDIPKATGPRRLTVTRYACKDQILDEGNFIGGFKHILDRLKPMKSEEVVHKTGPRKGEKVRRTSLGLGLITEDNLGAVEVIYIQERVDHRCDQRTEITIEDVA